MRTAPDLRVYFVIDTGLCGSAGRTVHGTVIAAVEGGTTYVQLRVKDPNGGPFLEEVLEVAKAISEKVPAIVNDRVDVFLVAHALRAQVAGVHVGRSDLSASLVRTLIGRGAYLGLSIGTQEEVQTTRKERTTNHVDLSVLRTTATKTDTPDVLGFEGCERLKGIVGIPAVAVGGVRVDDMAQLARVDIDKEAIVSAVCCAPDPAATAAQLLAQWSEGAQEWLGPSQL